MKAPSKFRIVAAAFLLAASISQAGTITVTDNLSYPNMSDTTCTLSQAIAAANLANGVTPDSVGSGTTDQGFNFSGPVTGTNKLGNCAGATAGANSIVFAPALAGATLAYTTADFSTTPWNSDSGTFNGMAYGHGNDENNLADNYWYGLNALPPIASSISIDGGSAGVTLQIAPPPVNRLRFFYVSGGLSGELPAGSLSLARMTLSGGIALGGRGGAAGAGMGGAIFNQGILNLTAVTLTSNSAIGGMPVGADTLGGGGMGDRYPASQAGGGMGGQAFALLGGPYALGGNYGGQGGQGAGSTGTYAGGGGGGFITGSNGGDAAPGVPGIGGGLGGLGGCSPGITGCYGDGGGGASGARNPGGNFGYGAPNTVASGGGGIGAGGGGGGGGGFGGGGPGGGNGGFGGGGAGVGRGGFGGGDGGGAGGSGAGMGGAIFNHRGSVNLTNVTMTGNSASGGAPYPASPGSGLGAAIFNLNGTVTIAYSTLANNTVNYSKGGALSGGLGDGTVYSVAYGNKIEDGTSSLAALTVTDSIITGTVTDGIAGNNDVVNNVVAGTHPNNTGNVATLTFTGSNIVGASQNAPSGTGATATQNGAPTSNTDPKLGALFNYGGPTQTMRPLPGSAAINAIAPVAGNCAVNTDQRGQPRPVGSGCDLGAVELTAFELDRIFADNFDGTPTL